MNPQTLPAAASAAALPENGYSAALILRCAVSGKLPRQKLEALRAGLHRAAASRAAAYTKGRTGAVTRSQAEAFYRSVLYQLDAALLALPGDSAAEEALRTQPLDRLLEAGQMRILQCYDEAKARFREAYTLTAPYETVFFRGVLERFAYFCTEYDARFHPDAIAPESDYPLLGDRRITLPGVLGVHAYYTALLHEGRFLALFPQDAVRTLMTRYAARFRTAPEMIAENIAELVLRQWLGCLLSGGSGMTLTLPSDAPERLTAEYAPLSAEMLLRDFQRVLAGSPVSSDSEISACLADALPALADAAHSRMRDGRLTGWLVPDQL